MIIVVVVVVVIIIIIIIIECQKYVKKYSENICLVTSKCY